MTVGQLVITHFAAVGHSFVTVNNNNVSMKGIFGMVAARVSAIPVTCCCHLGERNRKPPRSGHDLLCHLHLIIPHFFPSFTPQATWPDVPTAEECKYRLQQKTPTLYTTIADHSLMDNNLHILHVIPFCTRLGFPSQSSPFTFAKHSKLITEIPYIFLFLIVCIFTMQ